MMLCYLNCVVNRTDNANIRLSDNNETHTNANKIDFVPRLIMAACRYTYV